MWVDVKNLLLYYCSRGATLQRILKKRIMLFYFLLKYNLFCLKLFKVDLEENWPSKCVPCMLKGFGWGFQGEHGWTILCVAILGPRLWTDRQNDMDDWIHYLSATSLVGGNNLQDCRNLKKLPDVDTCDLNQRKLVQRYLKHIREKNQDQFHLTTSWKNSMIAGMQLITTQGTIFWLNAINYLNSSSTIE